MTPHLHFCQEQLQLAKEHIARESGAFISFVADVGARRFYAAFLEAQDAGNYRDMLRHQRNYDERVLFNLAKIKVKPTNTLLMQLEMCAEIILYKEQLELLKKSIPVPEDALLAEI